MLTKSSPSLTSQAMAHLQTLRSTMKVMSIVGWTRTGFVPFLSQTPYPMTIRMCLTSSSEMTPSHCGPTS
ncbi:hypothetical protein DPMN_068259 [Dreissena polymorpha]|uniref:Uncharacterized protein n=1 Tax=Dreissena polymorpha TaxID=45954 RepID=A0A9D4BTG4_DREPO|nr:hypothetical protein DPMN_068259 [Dreissena polymorpha]